MKKLILLLITAIFCMGNCAYADCANGSDKNFLYLQAFGGPNFLHTNKQDGVKPHFHTGYIVSGAFGFHWRYGYSIKAEYAYRHNSLSSLWWYGLDFDVPGRYQSSSYMGNILWDLPICCLWPCLGKLRPYIGGGIGYDVQHMRSSEDGFIWRRNDKGFAWQLIAAVSYPIFCNTEIAVAYKFHEGPLSHVYNNSVGICLSYKFGFCTRKVKVKGSCNEKK